VATAQDLIQRAFRRGRIIGKDETLSADDASDALNDLNDLLDEWRLDKLLVFHVISEPFTLVAGQQSYTMGPAGNFATTRPVKVVPGTRYTIASGIERQIAVLTSRKQWEEIPAKGVSGPPQLVFADMGMPTITLYFYPTPDQAYPVAIDSWGALQSLASLVTQVSLPPGYARLIVNGLAIAKCGEYGLEPPAQVRRDFATTKALLSLVNYEMPVLGLPSALQNRSLVRPNIVSGDTV